jgi:hypothetical protein
MTEQKNCIVYKVYARACKLPTSTHVVLKNCTIQGVSKWLGINFRVSSLRKMWLKTLNKVFR